jgi:hypothetical protein
MSSWDTSLLGIIKNKLRAAVEDAKNKDIIKEIAHNKWKYRAISVLENILVMNVLKELALDVIKKVIWQKYNNLIYEGL